MKFLEATLALLAQTTDGIPPAAPAADAPPDFRRYIWAAYGAVIIFLLGYSLWLAARLRSAERKLDHLRERIEPPGR